MNEPEFILGSGSMEPADSEHSSLLKIWDYSDSESAPASSWSTIPNRTLLCRPLPVDIGRCTCVIVKEKSVEGLHGGSLYTVYTNVRRVMEDNRKLAVARHKRHNGRSEYIVVQSTKGILGPGDDSFVGSVTSNLIGSKYNIWDQPHAVSELNEKSFWKMFDIGLYEQCRRKYGAIS
ncbi:tubby-like protein 8 [Apium graveolens]|uniref:tubby-like protein 8 n=1 Tax=Apium graveolens TaxID=4045 RepID=UPI003D79446A